MCIICTCIHNSLPYSLPDPVPLEKDSDGNPIRIDIPKPVVDNYTTVSHCLLYLHRVTIELEYAYLLICNVHMLS